MTPIVSIIIPVYNRPVLVAEAIESVLAQTNPNWELIVVDDGSTDHTWEVLESYAAKDKRIRVFKRDREPKGAPTCRNIGAGMARGEYLIFFDSDDILAPWAIENRILFSQRVEFDFMIFNGLEFDNSNLNNRYERANFRVKDPLDYFVKYQVAWGTANSFWRKSFFLSIEGWFEFALSNQDPILHLTALSRGAKIRWGNEVPDFFVRVEEGFNKISHNWSFDKTISSLESLEYVKKILSFEDYKKYQKVFFSDLINKLELLDKESLKALLTKGKKVFNDIPKNRGLRLYFFLFYWFKKIYILRGMVYRLRGVLTNWPRTERIRERTLIKEEIFKKLLKVAKPFGGLKKKIKVLQQAIQ